MRKRVLLVTFILLIGFVSNGYCFFDLIWDGIKFLMGEGKSVVTSIAKANGIKQTIDGIKYVSQNYKKAMQLYEDAKDLAGLSDFATNQFKARLDDAMKETWDSAGKNDKFTLGYWDKKAEDAGMDWTKKNLNCGQRVEQWAKDMEEKKKKERESDIAFGEKINKRIQDRDKQLKKLTDELGQAELTDDKKKQLQTEIALLQAEQNQDMMRLELKKQEQQLREKDEKASGEDAEKFAEGKIREGFQHTVGNATTITKSPDELDALRIGIVSENSYLEKLKAVKQQEEEY